MKIKDIFYKNIDRDIKGVIKIGRDYEGNVNQELDEYVVTGELLKHFSHFFNAYKNGITGNTDKIGVWISGFFGSGKSHFLKILSYLLENKTVGNRKAAEYFNDKIEDPQVMADIKLAGDTLTDVILFNIESKSDLGFKTNKDAIVKVFMRAFNDMQGFCGSIPWLADLERQMEIDGTYNKFKNAFREASGREWNDVREDFYYEEDSLIEALSKSTKMSCESARNWFREGEKNYSLSVEKFAGRVKKYIESKGENYHLVFLVDEIGQYIGNNYQLMLNLQTVVEDLGTECGGKAWIIVTSQQDIDTVTKASGNDFSKIQGRFNTRLSLSSANVSEVIKKRILKKNSRAYDTLKLLYNKKNSILKNLITFSADIPEKTPYRDYEDFIEVYPFVPYQFNLLQQVFISLGIHGVSGKHLIEGERSMLSSFQKAGVAYEDNEVGALIPFSAFYHALDDLWDSDVRNIMIYAEDNERLKPFDLEILKVLFMIKYLKKVPSTIENIATLMIESIDQDKIDLRNKIGISLKTLVKEAMVEKNGEEYVFLTYEEQIVNKKIRNINIDPGKIIQKVSQIIFEEIYRNKKYRYSARYIFGFNSIVDGRIFRGNQNIEIGIKVITPYFDHSAELTVQELKLMSFEENNLIIKLPGNAAFMEEMEEVLKIQEYLLQKCDTASTDRADGIDIRKSKEVIERRDRVRILLYDALENADMYVCSQKLDIKEKHPEDRINSGLKILVGSIYGKLNYINKYIDSSEDINAIFTESSMLMSVTEKNENKLAIQEINNYIERNTVRHVPIKMEAINSVYSKVPYGWNQLDIEGIVAKLFKMQEIRLKLNSEYIDISDGEVVKYITKKDYGDKIFLEKRRKIPVNQIKIARNLLKEFFGITDLSDDEDCLMRKFRDLSWNEVAKINELLTYYKQFEYPGENILLSGKKVLEKIKGINDPKEFYEKLQNLKDDLLGYEEDFVDVKKFFENQKDVFDKAVNVINIYRKNKTYLLNKRSTGLIEQIEKTIKSQKPYSKIHELPDLIDKFSLIFTELLESECEPVRTVIERDCKEVLNELNKYDFKEQFYGRFKNCFDDLMTRLDSSNSFYEVIAMKEESDRLKLRCFEAISGKLLIIRQKHTEDKDKTSKCNLKRIVNISAANILQGVKILESKEDIRNILDEIGRKLENELKEDIIIKLV
ncbi:BREX system P-loop protein BrxC [Clostridium sp. Mt-5]|uniref:BREX system P-loop protein BrxC n=1 Tax=Clostridium moutaii TaxID=3240932 RepID=A0ABV4BQK4_9CLOT